MTTRRADIHDRKTALVLLTLCVLYRIFFYARGGSFVGRPLNFALQYLDPALLRDDLLRSLFYQHSQPPLFNLLLGLVLKTSPDPALSYWFLFTTAGMLIPLLLYDSMVMLGAEWRVAAVATIAFMLNPTLLLYEHLLYYTHIETFLVLCAVCSLCRWCRDRGTLSLLLFWGTLLCLGLVRSLFHPLFFLALTILLFVYTARVLQNSLSATRLLAAGFLMVLLPLGILSTKNYLLYGFAGTSSWDGMSLWNKVNGYDESELEALRDRGIIGSRAVQAGFEPFKPIERYPGLAETPCHHSADCAVWKSTGKPNFNHSGYIPLSRELRRDALALIRHDPGRFALYTAGAYSLTLWYSSDSVHALMENNMRALEPLEKVYRFAWFGFLGARNRHSDTRVWLYTGAVTVLFLVLYGAGIAACCNPALRRNPVCLVILFCCVLHAYPLLVSSLVEFGENNRFRFPVDAGMLVLAAAILTVRKETHQRINTSFPKEAP